MIQTTTKRMGQLVLAAVAFCGLTSLHQEPTNSSLMVQVEHVGCQGRGKCGDRHSVQVKIHGQNPVGWAASDFVDPVTDSRNPGLRMFEIPVGAKVSISAFFPPHPLAEKWVDVYSADQQNVKFVLEPPGPSSTVKVEVSALVEAGDSIGGFGVVIKARDTGHGLMRTTVREVRRGVKLPNGIYDVEVRGKDWDWCGNGRPRSEAFVRDLAELSLEEGTGTSLQLQDGGLLKLTVSNSVAKVVGLGMKPMKSPDTKGQLIIGQRWGGDRKGLMWARLVSKESQKVYELEWGWEGLHYVIPWSEFPPNKQVYQIVPVPFGQYEPIIRGQSIQEYRQEVTLAPGKPVKLQVTAIPRGLSKTQSKQVPK